jgi:hypothetical protein
VIIAVIKNMGFRVSLLCLEPNLSSSKITDLGMSTQSSYACFLVRKMGIKTISSSSSQLVLKEALSIINA